MKVCLDVSAALSQGAGVSRYIRELLAALIALDDAPDITLFNNRRPNQKLDALPQNAKSLCRIEVPLSDRLWRMRLLMNTCPHQLKFAKDGLDVFHGTDVIVPALPAPSVVTLHDMTTWLHPQFHTRMNRWYQRLTLPLFMRRAAHIIADSQSTKNDLVRLTGVSADKVRVIHLGVDHNRFHKLTNTEAIQRATSMLHTDAPFFLAVGTLEPRKNLGTLLQAFIKSGLVDQGYKLVLTGMKGWNIRTLFTTLKLDTRLAQSVILTGYLQDEMLPYLYAASTAFVYPSIYEGFGLPVLEAMACGAAVIASNTSSLPEIAGNAAMLVKPTDLEAIAQAMQTIASQPSQAASYRSLSIQRASQFNWKDTAQQTLDVYRQVIADQPSL